MGMACGHLMIQPPVVIHFMEGPLRVLSLAQVVVGFHGVEVVADVLVAGEGFVDGSSKE